MAVINIGTLCITYVSLEKPAKGTKWFVFYN